MGGGEFESYLHPFRSLPSTTTYGKMSTSLAISSSHDGSCRQWPLFDFLSLPSQQSYRFVTVSWSDHFLKGKPV